jgi:integrase
MGETRQLPRGIILSKGMYRFDFRFNGKRWRLRTTFTEKNRLADVEKIFNTLVFDLESGRFNPSVFIGKIPNIEILGGKKDKYNMTDLLSEQMERYRNRQDLTKGSILNLESVIKLHLLPYFGDIDILTISSNDIESFIKQLKLSKDRVRLILRPLRHLFNQAIRDKIIGVNPFTLLEVNILSQHSVNTDYEVKPFSIEELELILSCCQHDTIRNFIKTAFYTGLRLGEMFALEWSDIDLLKEVINVNKSVSSVDGQVKTPKTKAGIRQVEMLAESKEALLAQLEITKSSTRVFQSPKGKNYLRTDGFGRYWRAALNFAKVEYRNPYQLRHSFISNMLMRGNSPLVLYRMVGHETPEIIYKYYARFISTSGKKILI